MVKGRNVLHLHTVNLYRTVKYSSTGHNIRELKILKINMVTGMRTRLYALSFVRNPTAICVPDETVKYE